MPGAGLLAGLFVSLGFLPAVAVPVVFLPGVRVAEDLVRLVQFLELFFHLALAGAGVEVGMVLPGQLAVGLFDLVRRGGPVHAQNIVVVSLRSRHRYSVSARDCSLRCPGRLFKSHRTTNKECHVCAPAETKLVGLQPYTA
jgi:hypothetical protein